MVKAGDTLYRVYEGYEHEPEMAAVRVKKVTKKYIFIEGLSGYTTGLAFNCRSLLPVEATVCTTPEAALREYHERAKDSYEFACRKWERAQAYLASHGIR